MIDNSEGALWASRARTPAEATRKVATVAGGAPYVIGNEWRAERAMIRKDLVIGACQADAVLWEALGLPGHAEEWSGVL